MAPKVKKAVEDKTFGLKNKNKSKKMQQYVQSVTTQMQNSGDKKKMEAQRARQAKKDAEKRAAEEERILFGAAAEEKRKQKEKEQEGMTVKQMMEEYEYQKAFSALGKPLQEHEGLIEAEIEGLRQKIPDAEKEPVTAEWFLAWAEEYNEKLRRKDVIVKKKKGPKKLTGRELFEQQAGAFEDDEEAESSWVERGEDESEEEGSGSGSEEESGSGGEEGEEGSAGSEGGSEGGDEDKDDGDELAKKLEGLKVS